MRGVCPRFLRAAGAVALRCRNIIIIIRVFLTSHVRHNMYNITDNIDTPTKTADTTNDADEGKCKTVRPYYLYRDKDSIEISSYQRTPPGCNSSSDLPDPLSTACLPPRCCHDLRLTGRPTYHTTEYRTGHLDWPTSRLYHARARHGNASHAADCTATPTHVTYLSRRQDLSRYTSTGT